MTDSEKLDLLLAEMLGMKDEMHGMKADIQGLKGDVQGLKGDVQGLKGDVQGLKGDVQSLKDDMLIMKADIQGLKEDVQNLKDDVQNLKEDVQLLKKKVINIELHLENSTDRNIRLLAENFIDLTNKLNQAVPAADNNRAYEVKVNYLIEEVRKLADEVSKIKERTA